MALAGGIVGQGYQCGMLWGAALAAGAQAYRLYGPGPQAETEAIIAAQRVVESFRAQNKYTNCSEITQIVFTTVSKKQMLKYFIKGGPLLCFSMSAKYAQVAYDEINSAYGDQPIEASTGPVSCTAVLARKMGVSDLQTVMAAGLAGGIGLSGDACGALGATIWIRMMEDVREGVAKYDLENPQILAVIERFLEAADYEFECSKIVGQKFEDVADHAAYVRDGGCSKIIDALATI